MNTTLTLATPVLAALLSIAGPAVARDRPGTPNEQKATSECGNPLLERPSICVRFNNTANEKVRFETEYRLNGDKVDRRLLEEEGVKFECFRNVSNGSGANLTPDCAALSGSSTWGRTTTATQQHKIPLDEKIQRDGITDGLFGSKWRPDDIENRYFPPQGFVVRNVRPGDEYCFRFRARRVSDQVVSQVFSNWACATGRALPQKPSAPPTVSVRTLKSEWDGTTSGRPFTYGVLVQWEGAQRAGQYVVSAPEGGFEPQTLDRNARQVIIHVPMEVFTRGGVPVSVCALNVAGRGCIRTLEAKVSDPTRERLGRRSGAVEAAKALFPSRVEPVPTPSSVPTPTTAAAGSALQAKVSEPTRERLGRRSGAVEAAKALFPSRIESISAPTSVPTPTTAAAGITKVPETAPDRVTFGRHSTGTSVLRAMKGLPDNGTAGFGGGLAIDPTQGLSSRMR